MATTPVVYGQYTVPTADECVNFGVGQPAPGLLPLARVRAAAAAKFAEEDPLFLQVRGSAARSPRPALRAPLCAPRRAQPLPLPSSLIPAHPALLRPAVRLH